MNWQNLKEIDVLGDFDKMGRLLYIRQIKIN